MKAVVLHEYGNPRVLKYEDFADPQPKSNEVLVRVAAASVNPIDLKRRSGMAKAFFPIRFPGILGADVAGTIMKVGPAVVGWKVGDQVLAYENQTYAELCAVIALHLVKVPQGMAVVDAAALPVVLTTGYEIIAEGVGIKSGQTVLIAGATGSVGRAAVFAAKQLGATVIAGVRKKHLADIAGLGADSGVETDDEATIAKLAPVDAVVDLVGGAISEKLIAKVKKGGVFASAVGPPANAQDFNSIKVVAFGAHPDAAILREMTDAVQSGKLTIPIGRKFPLKEAAAAHEAIEGGLGGKVLLVV